jgi:signal transduction histidine kinase
LTIQKKTNRASIIIVLIVVTVVSVFAYISIYKITELLIEKTYANLTISRDIKKQQIKDFFAERVSNIEVLAKSSDINILINALNSYLDNRHIAKESLTNSVMENIVSPHKSFLNHFREQYEYMDILILCANKGTVVYTQKNISDLGADLKSDAFKNSGLFEVWEKVLKLKKVVLIDMKPYKKIGDEPVMFIGAPVYIEDKLKAVLVFQISKIGLSKIMNFRKGYGMTQEDYLVGSDNLMRSDSYLCKSTYTLNGSLKKSTDDKCVIRATKEVLRGNTANEVIMNYNGKRVLSAYSPLLIHDDLNWSILSELDEVEALIVPNKIRKTIIFYSVLFILIIVLIILFIIYKMFKHEKNEAQKAAEMNQNLRKMNKELGESEYEVILKNEQLEIKVDKVIERNKQNKALLFQQSKMAAMGEMIGNIAHQWRQPLNALSALNVRLGMKYEVGKLSDAEMLLFEEKSNSLIQRMSSTIDDFRKFFYPNKSSELFRVDQAINEAIGFIKSGYQIDNIKLINYTSSKIEIKNYRNELIQVLLNIFNNSKDAIKGFNPKNGVVLVDVIISKESLKITIQDNGGGIKQEVIDRVFEPYFTTKFQDEGTGIGLYMSKMIIEESMNGNLKLENSENGVLTTIELYSN